MSHNPTLPISALNEALKSDNFNLVMGVAQYDTRSTTDLLLNSDDQILEAITQNVLSSSEIVSSIQEELNGYISKIEEKVIVPKAPSLINI